MTSWFGGLPGYGRMLRQPRDMGMFQGMGGPDQRYFESGAGGGGGGLFGKLGGWWEGLGDNKDDVIFSALGGLGSYLENRAERKSREKMHEAEMSLREREFEDQREERERRRQAWLDYMIRNGMRG